LAPAISGITRTLSIRIRNYDSYNYYKE